MLGSHTATGQIFLRDDRAWPAQNFPAPARRGGGWMEPWMSRPSRLRRCAAPAIFLPCQSKSNFSWPTKHWPGRDFWQHGRKLGHHAHFGKRQPQPVMDAPVTFRGLERMPFVAGRKNGTVGPVRIMRHDAAARRTPDERAQVRGAPPPRHISGNNQMSPPVPSSHRNATRAPANAAWPRATPRPAPC